MNNIVKAASVLINLANYGVGIAVAAILIFKLDFVSVFYIEGMTSNECLLFNLIMFQLGLVLFGLVLCSMTSDKKKPDMVIEFPIFYEIIPIIISAISIFYAFTGELLREKILVVLFAILYSVFSGVIVYSGARMFQIFAKEQDGARRSEKEQEADS